MELKLKFKEGFIRYKKDLENQLEKAKKERQTLIEKFTNGELLTAEDAQRNKRLADAIKDLERALDKVAEVEFYDNVEKTVIALANPTLTANQKKAGRAFVIKSFLAFNQVAIQNLSNVTDLTIDELKNISHTITTTRSEITTYRYDIHTLQKYGHPTTELEVKRKLAEEKLQILEQFKGLMFNETELEESLRNLSSSKTPDAIKEATINRYRKMIKRHKDLKIDNLVLDIKKNPITNLDGETYEVTETPMVEQPAIEQVEPTPVSEPVEVQTQEEKNIREQYEGPRLIDKPQGQQISFISNTPQQEEPVEIEQPAAPVPPIAPIPAKEEEPAYSWFQPTLNTNPEDDEVFTFVNPKTPFVFPEAEEEDEEIKFTPAPPTPSTTDKKDELVEPEVVEEEEIAEEMPLEEAPDAEYEQIEDDYEVKDKKWYHKAYDWLFGGYDYDDDYEIDEEYVDKYGNVYEEDPNSSKYKTKETLKKVGGWLKKSWKPIAGIAGSAIMVWSLCSVLKGCKKDETIAVKPEETTYEPTIETTLEPTTETTYANTTINNLIDKGYSEYNAILMADNFTKDVLDTVLSSPYNAAVENYATVKTFDYNYLNDYEEAKTIYGITSEKAVDYVNRSHKIMETGFYTDLTINEIVGVLKAVDDKQIFLDETNPYNHSITAALTVIYNDYAFGDGSIDNSVKKIEALKYFAPDGSDLDNFLTKFTEITKSVLKSRGNASVSEDTKQDMYLYLNVFANTFAGNTQDFNNPDQNAVVIDTFDWNTAYITFIRPLMSMYITESNAEDFACLQINMLSNYEQWIQINGYCNEETVALG